jgi:hypothetical protein
MHVVSFIQHLLILCSSRRSFTFDKLDTVLLDTTDENSESEETTEYQKYIDRCIKAPVVRRYLERKRFFKHVYVITGLKTVSGARCETTRSCSAQTILGAQIDGTILSGGMAPVGGGPKVRSGRAKKLNVSWKGSSDFVLAFKVSKVYVTPDGEVNKEKEYLKGAFLELPPENEEFIKLAAFVEQPGVDEEFSAKTVKEGDDLVAFGIPDATADDNVSD